MKKASSSTKKGMIIKGIGGFYYVRAEGQGGDFPHIYGSSSKLKPELVPISGSESEHEIIVCKARGLFRKNGMTPMIGDEVLVAIQKDDTGYIKEIFPRRNAFIRPPVANVDQIAVVMALADPQPHTDILDKFIVASEKNETDIRLVFNKIDLATETIRENFKKIYELLYPVYFVCGKTGEGVEGLKDILRGKKTAFAGPSGSGKSTLINMLTGRSDMETGDVSEKTGRGKHTTRHVELIETDFGAILFDTPGFTSFEMTEMQTEELEMYYPEIEKRRAECRFKGCSHISEPDCAVKKALFERHISQSRYDSYVNQHKTLKELKKW